MKLIPYLYVNKAKDLIEFYTDVFSANLLFKTTYAEMFDEDEKTEDAENKIAFASLQLPSGQLIYLSDTSSGIEAVPGSIMSLHLSFDNEEELRGIYEKLFDGGEITMELEETPWAALYGSIRDKFGVEWGLELDTAEEQPWN